MSWRWHPDIRRWAHRPWWKVAINTILRALQRRRKWKWVIYSRAVRAHYCTIEHGDCRAHPPIVRGYGFGKVEHLDE